LRLIDGPHPHQGPGRLVVRREHARRNVVIEKTRLTFGAAIRGGDLVCKGDVGARVVSI